MITTLRLPTFATALLGLAVSASSQDKASFTFRFGPGESFAYVEAEYSGVDSAELKVAMPAWKPGSYTIRNFGKKITEIHAYGPLAGDDAPELKLVKDANLANTWTIATGGNSTIRVAYTLNTSGTGIGKSFRKKIEPSESDSEGERRRGKRTWKAHLFEGPATWLYVPGHLDIPHTVKFVLPKPWRTASGLSTTKTKSVFTAPDYDVFADCPIHMGEFERLEFKVDKVPYVVILSGFEHDKSKREKLVDRLKKTIAAQLKVMGPAPFDRYTFLIGFPGGGGLEHLNSTNITMFSLAGSTETNNSIWDSLLSHEFFHLWNVKRLRPEALGPFDYSAPNRTDYLWLSEGVTSYYGDLLLVRAGVWNEKDYWTKTIRGEINTLQSNRGRLKMSIAEASRTVWDGPYMRRGFTAPDYYNKGHLLGLLLDIEIRDATDNKKSLDHVMRGLNEQCAETGKGFADGDVQKWCEKVSGRQFDEFFAKYINGTEELPYVETLAKIGLTVTDPNAPTTSDKKKKRSRRWKLTIDKTASKRAKKIRATMTH